MTRGPSAAARLTVAALWAAAAGLVLAGGVGALPRSPARHLAAELPPPLAPLAGLAAPDEYPTPPRIAALPRRPLASALARAARASAAPDLPRPFAALRMAAEPLLTPRLRLPRVLAPEFRGLRGLAARARPGEPVHVKLTAYCLRGTTRTSTRTRPGVVAADPRVFPLRRHVDLYAAGRHLGRFRVEDTGGAVRGPHIDIWTPSCDDARTFGTRAGLASLVRPGRD